MSSAIKPYIDLCRVSNLPTVWTNALAAIVLCGAPFSWHPFLVLAFSMSLFYSGGMCLNDMIDLNTDSTGKPFRPLPSGRLTRRKASFFTAALFLAAMSLLFELPHAAAIPAGALLLAFIVAYDVLHKAHPSSVFLMASCRLMVFVVSSLAVSGKVGVFVAAAGALQFLYILAVSVTARLENRLGNARGLPVIPTMLACISLLDGIVMAVLASPAWLAAGAGGTVLTGLGQRCVRGD